ncbi:MAG: hypothetical protein Q9P14_17245 [candidate division KSB1 bacterium]|nr:hypothetical protein [candidate division KSB1 bacterium]
MVDINLIGEEEKREPVTQQEPVRQGIDLDSSTFSTEEQSGSYISSYPPFDDNKGGSARKIIIASVLVIVAAAAGYFLFKGGEPADEVLETLSEPEQAEMMAEGGQAREELTFPEETTEQQTPMEMPQAEQTQPEVLTATPSRRTTPARRMLSPVEQNMVASLQASYAAIDNISSAISGQATLSLMRISGDSFILELVANSDSELAGLLSRVQNVLQTDNARIVHQENYTIHGPTSVKATIAGVLDRETLSAGGASSLQYFGLNEFLGWLRNVAQRTGMSVRVIKQSTTTNQDGYALTPLQISLDGSLQKSLTFLQNFAGASPNLRIEKISLINKDPRVNSNDAMSLVMVAHHFAR